MTRDLYLRYRIGDDYLPIIYEYVNNITNRKMSMDEIEMCMRFFPFTKDIINQCIDYFDKLFTIRILTYNNNILKIY